MRWLLGLKWSIEKEWCDCVNWRSMIKSGTLVRLDSQVRERQEGWYYIYTNTEYVSIATGIDEWWFSLIRQRQGCKWYERKRQLYLLRILSNTNQPVHVIIERDIYGYLPKPWILQLPFSSQDIQRSIPWLTGSTTRR